LHGYLGDIGTPPPYGPMDFAAWFEAYLGGRCETGKPILTTNAPCGATSAGPSLYRILPGPRGARGAKITRWRG
jgi:hypothetical protein